MGFPVEICFVSLDNLTFATKRRQVQTAPTACGVNYVFATCNAQNQPQHVHIFWSVEWTSFPTPGTTRDLATTYTCPVFRPLRCYLVVFGPWTVAV